MFFGRVTPTRPDIKLFPVVHVFNLLTLSLVTETLVFIFRAVFQHFQYVILLGFVMRLKLFRHCAAQNMKSFVTCVTEFSIVTFDLSPHPPPPFFLFAIHFQLVCLSCISSHAIIITFCSRTAICHSVWAKKVIRIVDSFCSSRLFFVFAIKKCAI
jgi:hypothetical protein